MRARAQQGRSRAERSTNANRLDAPRFRPAAGRALHISYGLVLFLWRRGSACPANIRNPILSRCGFVASDLRPAKLIFILLASSDTRQFGSLLASPPTNPRTLQVCRNLTKVVLWEPAHGKETLTKYEVLTGIAP